MTDKEVVRLLKIEHACSQANCDRNCNKCEIVQEQSTLDDMYKTAIEIIEENTELKAKLLKIENYLANDIPHELMNEATNKIWRML